MFDQDNAQHLASVDILDGNHSRHALQKIMVKDTDKSKDPRWASGLVQYYVNLPPPKARRLSIVLNLKRHIQMETTSFTRWTSCNSHCDLLAAQHSDFLPAQDSPSDWKAQLIKGLGWDAKECQHGVSELLLRTMKWPSDTRTLVQITHDSMWRWIDMMRRKFISEKTRQQRERHVSAGSKRARGGAVGKPPRELSSDEIIKAAESQYKPFHFPICEMCKVLTGYPLDVVRACVSIFCQRCTTARTIMVVHKEVKAMAIRCQVRKLIKCRATVWLGTLCEKDAAGVWIARKLAEDVTACKALQTATASDLPKAKDAKGGTSRAPSWADITRLFPSVNFCALDIYWSSFENSEYNLCNQAEYAVVRQPPRPLVV